MHKALENQEYTLENPDAVMMEYKRTGDVQLRNQLVLHYSPYVKASIYSMRSLLLSNIPIEDFFNQGILVLIECIERFNLSKGAKVDTYMYKIIRGRLINYARKQNWMPNRVWNLNKQIHAVRMKLEESLNRVPTEQEIAQEMGLSWQEYEAVRMEISRGDTISLEDLFEKNWDQFTIRDLEISENSVDENIMRQEKYEQLAAAIQQLSPRYQQVIALCYYENLNLRETGEVLGLSQQRVSQIRASALTRLKKLMEDS